MIYDTIIIGGGPAGITAGIYGARKRIKTLLITKDFIGQMGKTGSIENWPGLNLISGQELIENFKNHLKKFTRLPSSARPPASSLAGEVGRGAKATGGQEIEISEGEEIKEIKKEKETFEIATLHNRFQAKAVIVASGRNPRPLKVPGEEKFMGKGVSFCSICDAPLFKDKVVAVVGGGNSGFETALDLAKYSSKIYLLEFSPQVKADEISQERAKATEKISVIINATVKEIKGKDFVERLVYEDRISKQLKELEVQGIFVEIGFLPATAFLGDLVEFNQLGEIKINPKTCATKTPGLFAAGDVTDVKYKQIIVACGEGAKAALSAYEYLQNK